MYNGWNITVRPPLGFSTCLSLYLGVYIYFTVYICHIFFIPQHQSVVTEIYSSLFLV
jgi:hypothetical protein